MEGEGATPPSVDSREVPPVQVGPGKTVLPRRAKGDRDAIPTILDFVECAEYLALEISPAQRTLLKAIYGLPLDEEEFAIFCACTGRTEYTPGSPVAQVTVIAGRRSGKDSRIAAPIAVYEAVYRPIESSTGEPVVVPIVAQNERGARVAFKYISGYARKARVSRWVHDERMSSLVLENACTGVELEIQCFACKAAALRGWSIPAAVMDEVAYFSVEAGLEKDEEIQTAIEGAGIHFERQLIVKISTPAGKRGLLYTDSQAYWGVNHSDVLVWKAPSRVMNPKINAARIERARVRNPEAARSEYDAEFRADVETFIPRELIDLAAVVGRLEVPPAAERTYVAAVDPTGGTGPDSFTLAVVHVEWREERPVIVQDVMRGWKRSERAALDLTLTVTEIAAVLRPYGVTMVIGDAYAGDWPTQEFRKVGITYEKSDRDKAGAFLELQPWMARGDLELLEHADLAREMSLLERKATLREKKPAIGHPKGGHDDYPNALAQAVAKLSTSLHAAAEATQDPRAARAPGHRPAELDDPDRGAPAGSGKFWAARPGQFWGAGLDGAARTALAGLR